MHHWRFAMTQLVTHATLALSCGHANVVHWGYEAGIGPEHWASLDPSFALCGDGHEQTPVDLPAATTPGEYPGLSIDYRPTRLDIINNGHTVQVNYGSGSTITVDGTKYDLRQFHFHAHSEHTIAGKDYPLELHLVHENAQGGLAVLAIFIEPGPTHDGLAPVFSNLPEEKGERTVISGSEIDASSFLPKHHWMWRYAGSLTTPPCSEGVKWYALSEPIQASTEQIAAFTKIFGNNHRPTQELGQRVIEGAHFAYEGESGPSAWGELAPSWKVCAEGRDQSPIDIPASATAEKYAALKVDYASSALNIFNSGHTVQVNYDAGSKIALAGTEYALRQFHFHAHSEHQVASKSWPLELHLVHENAQGGLAVVGVFIKEGAENIALASVFDNLPATMGAAKTIAGATVQAKDFWPSDHAMWRYDGSLTTPPCSQGVKWHVLATPIEASSAQIARFTQLFHDNARPIQELGGRVINAP